MTDVHQKQQRLHVAVAALVKDHKVLISKRPEHVHQGGLWEFPGGKVEPGETIEAALKREIQEELGINIHSSRPLIKLSHHYKDKSVLLDTYRVERFETSGGYKYPDNTVSTGAEGQLIQWVPISQLRQYAFPAANAAIINALQLPPVYAISADFQTPTMAVSAIKVLLDKYQLVQIRLKSLSGKVLEETVKQMMEKERNKVRILFNSSMQLPDYLHQQSAGLHLTSRHLFNDALIAQYKKTYPEKLISASCHNQDEIEWANALKLDFITLSPVQKTRSHPEQPPLGWEPFELLTELATMPVYALGGVQIEDVAQAGLYGAQGVAGIRNFG